MKTYGSNRDENGAMGNGGKTVGTPKNEEILEEARVEPIATVMRRRRLEWFGQEEMKQNHPSSCGNEEGGEAQ